MISFTVYGLPQAKGSTKSWVHPSTKRVVTTSTSKGLRSWHQEIVREAMRVKPEGPVPEGPVTVALDFMMPKPKSFGKTASLRHGKRPDLDKLARAVLDALTGVLFADDGQVWALSCFKLYAQEAPGVKVEVHCP